LPAASLCRPRPDLSCFGCCPPIRPQGYDHLDFKAGLVPQLRANTEALAAGQRGGFISGVSCWGLGFLDQTERLVGCLIHPAQNQGRDLRVLTGFQDKCARELCPQARVFAVLEEPLRATLLDLAIGPQRKTDSFVFSSPKKNPLWKLLDWGPVVLGALQEHLRPGRPFFHYLTGCPAPKARAHLLAGLLARLTDRHVFRLAQWPGFGHWFEAQAVQLCHRLRPKLTSPLANQPPVHRLGLEPSLADFLRLGLGLAKLDKGRALALGAEAETALEDLAGRLRSRCRGWSRRSGCS